MKMKIAFVLSSFAISASAFASGAVINTNDGDGNYGYIALDSKGVPRESGAPKTYPTIKDFRDDSDYHYVCAKGSDKEVRDLLTALVAAADGDGDSWAELVSIKKDAKSTYVVRAKITDEGGEHSETFTFEKCKK